MSALLLAQIAIETSSRATSKASEEIKVIHSNRRLTFLTFPSVLAVCESSIGSERFSRNHWALMRRDFTILWFANERLIFSVKISNISVALEWIPSNNILSPFSELELTRFLAPHRSTSKICFLASKLPLHEPSNPTPPIWDYFLCFNPGMFSARVWIKETRFMNC